MLKLLLVLAAALAVAVAQQTVSRRRKVIVDVDVGSDDAMALLLLLSKYSNLDVIAVTCVTGNTGISNVTRNLLRTLTVAGRLDIPVYAGSSQGLVYPEKTDSFWGDDGFGDFTDPFPIDMNYVRKEHAAIVIAKLVNQFQGLITILALGPLTNIALAAHLTNNFFDKIDHIVILGGSYQGGGNVKAGIEFNIYADPEAASYVFSQVNAAHSMVIVPLETIEKSGVPMDFRINVLGALKSRQMQFLNKAEAKAIPKQGNEWTFYDQTAAAILLQPDIVEEYIKRKISIETQGANTRGAMIVDHRSKTGPITIITSINKEKIKQLFLRNLS